MADSLFSPSSVSMTSRLDLGSTRGLARRERLGTTPSCGVVAAVQSTWLSFPEFMRSKYTPRIFAGGCPWSAAPRRWSDSRPAVGCYLPPVLVQLPLSMSAWILFSVVQLRVVPEPLSPLSNASSASLSRTPLAHHR